MKICRKCGTRYDDTGSFCPRDSEPLYIDHESMVGRSLDGQYEIEAFLAEGGMGAVYRARHTLLGDRVAIKILPPEMRHNAEWLRRFQREGQAARRFRHPNAVVVHDLRTSTQGEVYLVMEYVEGQTLDEWARARGGKINPVESLLVIEQVASVLDAAHAVGVVHRDLKPSNIMITAESATVKLLDLGIAKINSLTDSGTVLTRSGQFLGTPYYMAPEQWGEMPRDGHEEIDGRADIYSLGVVVYEITAGVLPFQHSTLIALRQAHCKERPRPLAEVASGVPAGWAAAVERAMSKDRSDRPATAGEFGRELRASLGALAPARDASILDDRAAAPTIKGELLETGLAGRGATPQGVPAVPTHDHAAITAAPAVQQVAQPKRSWTLGLMTSRGCQVSLTVAAVLVITVLGGGFWTFLQVRNSGTESASSNMTPRRPSVAAGNPATSNANSTANTNSTVPGEAVMSYYLLISPTILDTQKRVTGEEAIPPGQSLQFVFKPSVDGYVYAVGHDSRGNRVSFPLGDLDADMSGLKIGKVVKAGQENPAPVLARIKLDDMANTAEFITIIFSREPLKASFLSATLPMDGSFRKLTADELRQLYELKKESPPVQTRYAGANNDRMALVQQSVENGKPVVFDIKLKLERP